ncbi:MAG: hypothetical protein AUJ49_10725 [Desulfovibrionaceae bacterium CG1_02_65_16]|nr:MAG: hypothetical protein AUJ49_10725 [Desulfovibrionaceae bacterium CG1_02_65_16]
MALLLAVLVLPGCDRNDKAAYTPRYGQLPPTGGGVYIFGPHPLMNPQKLAEVYGALLDKLNRQLAPEHIQLRLEASLNYAVFNKKIIRHRLHFALPNPYQTVLSQDHGYVIFGKMNRDDDFRGIILLQKGAPISSVEGLAGARVSFPAPTALAATLMPELFLKEHGLDPRRDIIASFVGTHDSAMLNVCLGVSDAACTWPIAWRNFQEQRPDQARRIEVRWRTPPLPNNGLVALSTVPQPVREKVARALFALGEDAEGRRLLDQAGVGRFVPADNATFAPVRQFINRYNRSVRQLQGLNE